MATTTTARLEFEALVQKAEAEVAANPAAYRRKLAMLAMLGYVVIFALLALLIAILGGSIAAAMVSSAFLILLLKQKLILLVVMPIWVLGRSLFVRVKAPDGFTLSKSKFPQVWDEIDALRSQLNALPIHTAILTPDMNAAVTQTPRLGIFGPYKNTLVLGLELLMSMTPEQARAVLAHEFGHLSHQHGRFGTWIYRKRLTWARIGAAFDARPTFGMGLLRKFMSWYIPRLAGYSFALARRQEYEADAAAAELTSPQHLATALVLANTRAPITAETFWKPLWQRANTNPEPEAHTFSKLFHFLKTVPLSRALAAEKLNDALRAKTDHADTHPSLTDRLRALGQSPAFAFGQTSAAEAWLGAKLKPVLREFDKRWLAANSGNWAQRHEYAKLALARLSELMGKREPELKQEEAWQKANLIEDFRPDMDAIAAFTAYQDHFPEDPRGHFSLGRLLINEHNDPSGITHLARAAQDVRLKEPACGAIAAYYHRNNHPELAESWLRKAEAAHDENNEARKERSTVTAADDFKATRLDADAIKVLTTAIKNTSVGKGVKEIWLAEKVVKRFPEDACHVVLLKPKIFARGKTELSSNIAHQLPRILELANSWYFVVDNASARGLSRKVKRLGRPIPIA